MAVTPARSAQAAATDPARQPARQPARVLLNGRLERAFLWSIARGSAVWPFLILAIVLSLTWGALRQITTPDVRAVLHVLDVDWLLIAAAITGANIAVMGLYDVIAFRRTRSRWPERWCYGAVAFAWSNFLTLGPLAGPAIRFWLYRPADGDDQHSSVHTGVIAVATAFTAGLVGWTVASLLAARVRVSYVEFCVYAFAMTLVTCSLARAVARRMGRFVALDFKWTQVLLLASIGWLDWLLAAAAFISCVKATGADVPLSTLASTFFLGQALGLVSLIPGGFGASDAFWIAHLTLVQSAAAAALTAYRLIYYAVPWAIASLLLLAWVAQRTPRRTEVARRILGGLVGGSGVLIILSTASPALHARLVLLRHVIPLSLVEAGQMTAAFAGLLLLVLARGLTRGYRTAFRATLTVLWLAGLASILKGLDWEETVVLGAVAIIVSSQAALFDRPSRGRWLEGPDLVLAFAALVLFVTFGILSYHVNTVVLQRWTMIGYGFQRTRFVRSAVSMLLAVGAAALYLIVRAPVGFARLSDPEIARTLQWHARIGGSTNPLMVATGDKAVFSYGALGFCLYRTIGPYLVVFADPVVRLPSERAAFLDALFAFAEELDRRLVLYQISVDWVPFLHDRGCGFFKLGEQADVALNRVTLEGHEGKLYRQILRRAERDGVRFRILAPEQIEERLQELTAISDEWLGAKGVTERQFSLGFFDPAYLRRFPCAIVEEIAPGGRILAFANLLEGPKLAELSVDLMRHRSDGPHVMDFLLASVFLDGKTRGYQRFNLGMAPLASVGDRQGAHLRERLARVLFQRGKHWYNFQGLRQYKEKFDPEWVPRYMAYQDIWEWPMAIANVSALIAGGWSSALLPASQGRPAAMPIDAKRPQMVEG